MLQRLEIIKYKSHEYFAGDLELIAKVDLEAIVDLLFATGDDSDFRES